MSRSRTVDTPHGGGVLSGVPIEACPNVVNLSVRFAGKLPFDADVLYLVTSREYVTGILMTVNSIFDDTSALLRCY